MVSMSTNIGAMSAHRYIEHNSEKVVRATEALASGSRVSNPSYDASASAIGTRLNTIIGALNQASRNMSQALSMIQLGCGSLQSNCDILTRMKTITTQSNSDTVGATERAMLNQEFQDLIKQVDINATSARWGGSSLFTGSVGTVTAGGVVAEGASGLVAVGNNFAGTMNATSTQGLISGVATDARVTANGNTYNVSVTIGNQVFTNSSAVPTNSSQLVLTSTTDSGNVVSFDFGASSAAGLTTAALFQTALQTMLGIGNGAARANFTSGSVANGLTLGSGSGLQAGTWGLNYTVSGGVGTFKLTNGLSSYTQTITPSASTTQTVTFGNGASIVLSAFDTSASLGQQTYTVTAGTGFTTQFEYGELSTDTLSVSFGVATSTGLLLSGLNVSTAASAQVASNAVDAAVITMGNFIASLGAKASQLNFMQSNLRVSIANQSAAQSTFVDTNVSESMMDLQKYKSLQSISNTVFTQSLNQQSELAQMVGQVR